MGLNIDQQINFLKKIDFFENFDDHELRQFLAVTKWLKVPVDTLIIKENTMERVFYVLVKGEVSVFKTIDEGKRCLELTTLKSGACFGEMSLVMDVKRTAGVVTRCDSFLLMVEPGIINTSNVFLQLKFYKRFCEILVSRLIMANERMAGAEPSAPIKAVPKAAAAEAEFKAVPEPAPLQAVADLGARPGQGPPTVKVQPGLPEKKDRVAQKALQRQIAAAMELPFNPAVAERLAPLLRGECENTLLLADLVQLDPVLALRVMQTANSSFYRRSLPVATVPHAMITVGIKHIQETLSQVINGGDRRRKLFGGFKPVAIAYWRHSIIVARIAVLLRDVIRLSLTTDIYLAGLLHDIGILALDAVEPKFYPHLQDQESELCANLCLAEMSYIGIDHCQAGALLGESIGLPETYLDVMRFHHDPAATRNSQLSVALVHLAELFATMHGCGHCPGKTDPLPLPLESFAWAIIQENHRPFCEVNVPDFINTFDQELTTTWGSICDGSVNF